MNIFTRLFSNPPIVKKSMPQTGLGGGAFISPPPAVDRSPLNLLSLNVGFTAAVNNINARNVASSRIRLYANGNNGKKILSGVNHKKLTKAEIKSKFKNGEQEEVIEIYEHPALDLLQAGAKHLDAHGLMQTTEQYLGALGQAYWYIDSASKGIPDRIEVLPAEFVNLMLTDDGEETGYKVRTGGYTKDYDIEDVICFRNIAIGGYTRANGLSPEVGLYGQGFIEQCLQECELLRSISILERTIANDPRPSTIFSLKEGQGELDEGQVRLLTRQLEQYMSTRNGKSAFFPSAIDVNPLQLAPKEMAYVDGRRWLTLVIATAAGVPLDLINSENSNRAVSMTAFRSYANLTLVPKLARLADTLTKQLLPRYDEGLFFAYDDPTPLDEESESRAEDTDLRNGVITINESRAKRGLGDVKWGFSPFIPAKETIRINNDDSDKTQENPNDSLEQLDKQQEEDV